MRLYIITILGLLHVSSSAQTNFDTIVERSHWRAFASVPFPQLGIQHERKLSANTSVGFEASVLFIAGLAGFGNGGSQLTGSFHSYAGLPFRWYYSQKRRLEKGHRIRNFSGFYVGAEPFYRGNDFAVIRRAQFSNPIAGLWVNWGIQLERRSGLLFGTQIGALPMLLSLNDQWNETVERVRLQVRVGYRLNRN